ncbi:hypothetical protein SmJEL517_g06187 [Synchytrium microbalum]|uniref:LIM zinc-binding domain-containing protein n=1 Tax=Synchytrium microbalum TaxID=1806994 RepID=A0A507BJS2_9FUNG|nr:uncharacterized protein SmJEL517_g06187 [Synchytrium microbalum]TPX30197.1 hypothetical protein SmJEL517_g06187 [Synchytrium microbalum]
MKQGALEYETRPSGARCRKCGQRINEFEDHVCLPQKERPQAPKKVKKRYIEDGRGPPNDYTPGRTPKMGASPHSRGYAAPLTPPEDHSLGYDDSPPPSYSSGGNGLSRSKSKSDRSRGADRGDRDRAGEDLERSPSEKSNNSKQRAERHEGRRRNKSRDRMNEMMMNNYGYPNASGGSYPYGPGVSSGSGGGENYMDWYAAQGKAYGGMGMMGPGNGISDWDDDGSGMASSMLRFTPVDELVPMVKNMDAGTSVCAGCNGRIWDPNEAFEIESMQKLYHETCFNCVICRKPFSADCPYIPHEGKAYCEADYEALFQTCAHCNMPVHDNPVHALGKVFHEKHLRCGECNKQITGSVFEHDGQVLCPEDYTRLVSSTCRKCDRKIDGETVVAMNNTFHRECFTCNSCGKGFPDKSFYVFEELPYCKFHYHEMNNSLCGYCHKPIEGPCAEVSELSKRFHPECWVCNICSTPLTSTYYSYNGEAYCEKDINRVYNPSKSSGSGSNGSRSERPPERRERHKSRDREMPTRKGSNHERDADMPVRKGSKSSSHHDRDADMPIRKGSHHTERDGSDVPSRKGSNHERHMADDVGPSMPRERRPSDRSDRGERERGDMRERKPSTGHRDMDEKAMRDKPERRRDASEHSSRSKHRDDSEHGSERSRSDAGVKRSGSHRRRGPPEAIRRPVEVDR